MKQRFKSGCGLLFFFVIRGAERIFSVRSLYRVLIPLVMGRAAINTAFKKLRPQPALPEFLLAPGSRRSARQFRQNYYLNHFLEFFPERLAEAKWADGCHIEGLDRLQEAGRNRRPVVLAFCHFGSYFLLHLWLRAAGIPAAVLVGGLAADRPGFFRLENRFSPFPGIPTAFYEDQLRQAANFLAFGNPLLVSIDTPLGKQSEVPFCADWTFQMGTVALRLAARHQAELVPCSIVDLDHWRFRIVLGRPVPREFLARETGWVRAGKHLLAEMLPVFQAHPEQCAAHLLRCLRRDSPGGRLQISEQVGAGHAAKFLP